MCVGLPADIYDKVQEELSIAGMETECLGGGRILHDTSKKTIHVFGYSQVFPSTNVKLIAALTLRQLLFAI